MNSTHENIKQLISALPGRHPVPVAIIGEMVGIEDVYMLQKAFEQIYGRFGDSDWRNQLGR
jgi:hypothetical protein